jgi:hypothetical protein
LGDCSRHKKWLSGLAVLLGLPQEFLHHLLHQLPANLPDLFDEKCKP